MGLDARPVSVILARSPRPPMPLRAPALPTWLGKRIDRAINLGAIYAPIPPRVGARISLERR
jgi:hypothetical protein